MFVNFSLKIRPMPQGVAPEAPISPSFSDWSESSVDLPIESLDADALEELTPASTPESLSPEPLSIAPFPFDADVSPQSALTPTPTSPREERPWKKGWSRSDAFKQALGGAFT